MSKLGINTGTNPNDGTGDSLLSGAVKINSNFDELYTTLGDGATLSTPVTSIVAGTNVSVSSSTGDVTINATSGGSINGITIKEEGVSVGTATSITSINFVGSDVTATATGQDATITISSSGGGSGGAGVDVQDEGVALATTATTLNFVGDGVIASGTGATKTITISGFSTENVSTNSLVVSGVATATTFNGNLTGNVTGNADTATTATSATYASSSGIATYATTSGIATYSSTSGIATFATTSGISTYTSEWVLGADGSNNFYSFTGPGFTGSENDPTLYLTRGQQYKFVNSMNAHPFRIQSTPNGNAGTEYNDGIPNNNVQNGVLTWDVQFDAPNKLYYQCTSHPNMGGPIYIVPRIEPAVGVRTEVSGTTAIAIGATNNLNITGFKSYGLLKVGISSAAWVRLYIDEASRTSDASRSYLTDPSPGSGLIAEVRTETAGSSTFLMTPGVIGYNNDVSVGTTIYSAVTNNESSIATITVDLTVIKMED